MMSAGFRGGWSWTLGTGNPMSQPGDQPSLSGSLRAGTAMAHRGQMGSVPETQELRNYRRTTPLKMQNRIAESQPALGPSYWRRDQGSR